MTHLRFLITLGLVAVVLLSPCVPLAIFTTFAAILVAVTGESCTATTSYTPEFTVSYDSLPKRPG